MKDLAKAILVIGLACVSAYLIIQTDGKYGEECVFLAFMVLLLF
jgi:hypothetical protein